MCHSSKKKLLTCKRLVNVSTSSVRTLTKQERRTHIIVGKGSHWRHMHSRTQDLSKRSDIMKWAMDGCSSQVCEKRGEIFKHQGSTAINEPLCIWNSSQRGISKPKNPGGNIQWQPQTTIVSCYHPANLSEETDASVFLFFFLQPVTRCHKTAAKTQCYPCSWRYESKGWDTGYKGLQFLRQKQTETAKRCWTC